MQEFDFLLDTDTPIRAHATEITLASEDREMTGTLNYALTNEGLVIDFVDDETGVVVRTFSATHDEMLEKFLQ